MHITGAIELSTLLQLLHVMPRHMLTAIYMYMYVD